LVCSLAVKAEAEMVLPQLSFGALSPTERSRHGLDDVDLAVGVFRTLSDLPNRTYGLDLSSLIF
jgi:hypothetical protein